MSDQRVPLPGSEPKQPSGTGAQPRWSPAVDPDEKASATVTLRRRHDSAAAAMEKQLLSGEARPLPREQAAHELSADPRDLAAVRSFLEQHGLTVVNENAAARTLKIEGTVPQMEEAFGTKMGWLEDASGHRHLSYRGPLSVPQSLDGIITSIIGLDQRPIARRHSSSL